ncbi:Hypothetical predicted protein, partial [Mytilus galloprovincialis]
DLDNTNCLYKDFFVFTVFNELPLEDTALKKNVNVMLNISKNFRNVIIIIQKKNSKDMMQLFTYYVKTYQRDKHLFHLFCSLSFISAF